MIEVFPFVKNQQMIDDAEKLRQFMTDARGCGLESLNTTPATQIAAEMAGKYPDLFKVETGLEGLSGLLTAMDADIDAPMTQQQFTHTQYVESGLEAREKAVLIRDHVAAMRAGVESFEDHPDHIAMIEMINDAYPDVLKGTGLETLERVAAGLENMSDIIAKANAEGTNGAIDWGAVFEAVGEVAAMIRWRAFSPKGITQNRTLSRAVATLLSYGEQERYQAAGNTYGMPNIIKNRGMVFDKYVMVGQNHRGVAAVMAFTIRNVSRFTVMEVDEMYMVPEARSAENLEAMRDFVRIVARANGYNAADIIVPAGVSYLEATFKGENYRPVSKTVATTFF